MNYNRGTGTISEHYIDDLVIDLAPACIAPQNVHTSYLSDSQVDIVWSRSNSSSYTVEYGVHGFTFGTGAQTTVSTRNVSLTGLTAQTSYTITGLNGSSTTYYIWVAGECSAEQSRPIAVQATTLSNCGPVEDLTLSGVDFNAFGLSWNAPSIGDAATSYVVYLRQCTNTPYDNQEHWIMDTVTSTYYMFSGLEEATTYAYAVRTLCGSDNADYDGGYVTTTICEMDTVGDYGANYSAQPIYATQAYSYTQQIYMASELNGIDSISSLAFYQRGGECQCRGYYLHRIHCYFGRL